MRFMVVDFNDATRLQYKTALAAFGEVVEASDGAEALGMAICAPPTVVVTDTRLPRVERPALCSLLRQDPATAKARIVVFADGEGASLGNQAMAAGADVVLEKGCAIDDLVAV